MDDNDEKEVIDIQLLREWIDNPVSQALKRAYEDELELLVECYKQGGYLGKLEQMHEDHGYRTAALAFFRVFEDPNEWLKWETNGGVYASKIGASGADTDDKN